MWVIRFGYSYVMYFVCINGKGEVLLIYKDGWKSLLRPVTCTQIRFVSMIICDKVQDIEIEMQK